MICSPVIKENWLPLHLTEIQFYVHLRNRGYPHWFLSQVFSDVDLNHRVSVPKARPLKEVYSVKPKVFLRPWYQCEAVHLGRDFDFIHKMMCLIRTKMSMKPVTVIIASSTRK